MIHNHLSASVSGCYYYKTSGKDGNIFFRCPLPQMAANHSYAGHFGLQMIQPEETKIILNNIKNVYEDFHNVTFDDAAIKSAVDYSVRYITNRFLPDKAIDIIDEAGARLHLDNLHLCLLHINPLQNISIYSFLRLNQICSFSLPYFSNALYRQNLSYELGVSINKGLFSTIKLKYLIMLFSIITTL